MTPARSTATDPGGLFEERPVTDAPPILRATDLTGVHVLKHDNLFMLSNAHGDVRPDGRGLGLYDCDTRVLSTYDLLLNGTHPVVLRAGPAASYHSTIQLTNPDLLSRSSDQLDGSEIVLRRQSLGVVRERVINGGFGERISITNYTAQPERARLTLRLDADYADIFELRGVVRPRRGSASTNSRQRWAGQRSATAASTAASAEPASRSLRQCPIVADSDSGGLSPSSARSTVAPGANGDV